MGQLERYLLFENMSQCLCLLNTSFNVVGFVNNREIKFLLPVRVM